MKLSIIICTRNRDFAIADCLTSIEEALAEAAPVDAEIVVVDNGSTDGTSARVRAWAAQSRFPVNLVFEAKKGLSAARNCGTRAACGEILAFTDDDCRPALDYVQTLLRYNAEDKEPVLRGGRVELGDPADLPLTIQTNPDRLRWHRRADSTWRSHLGGGIIPGCNMVMRRQIVDRLGPFDEALGAGSVVPAGEDTDYVFRAYLAGIAIEYVPDMTVYHFHGRKDPAEGRALIRNYLLGTGALYAKYNFRHPNLRRKLVRLFSRKAAANPVRPAGEDRLAGIDYSTAGKIGYCMKGAFLYLARSASCFRQSM